MEIDWSFANDKYFRSIICINVHVEVWREDERKGTSTLQILGVRTNTSSEDKLMRNVHGFRLKVQTSNFLLFGGHFSRSVKIS